MTTKTDEQERGEFEAWIASPPYEKPTTINPESSGFPGQYRAYEVQLAWEAYRAGRAALQSQPMLPEISRGLLGKIVDEVFDGAIEDASVIEDIYRVVARECAMQSQDREDAERYRWLTEDHTDAETRTRCREILDRMAVMSYSAACVAIDHACRIEEEMK